MKELRHQTSELCNAPEEEMSWPDTADVISVAGATSVILRLTEEEAPPEYEEAPDVSHWEGRYTDLDHEDSNIEISFAEGSNGEVLVHATCGGEDNDEQSMWEANGRVLSAESLLINFSHTETPKAMEGRWTGTGISWVDGEESAGADNWVKIQEE
eukprot:TRINITY_DN46315_c0_g1_i1.p2 TRINITY_DN46315_c0_g1~~TRINITY_DN46315_c0_g1_i1.p2  ORF type:complete len:156 (+),score=42.76 TRINITY_DN46315_c0_g1_i1:146-613(+)